MNIFIGNLSYNVTEGDLRQTFVAFGQVASATVIKDEKSGRSKGFGFVEMPEQAEAQSAIAALNGQAFKGRTITVNEAQADNRREIAEEGDIDAAEGVTNKAIRQYRCASFPLCSAHVSYDDLHHYYNEISFIQEVRPLTICRNLTSLRLNSWDERQRKKVRFDTGKN